MKRSDDKVSGDLTIVKNAAGRDDSLKLFCKPR